MDYRESALFGQAGAAKQKPEAPLPPVAASADTAEYVGGNDWGRATVYYTLDGDGYQMQKWGPPHRDLVRVAYENTVNWLASEVMQDEHSTDFYDLTK